MRRTNRDDSIDDPRRRFLVRALSLGLLAGGTGWNRAALAALFGKLPGKLPEGRSIFEFSGDVRINGRPASQDTVISPSDRVETGGGSHVIYAVGPNAYIVRERSVL